jgi:eukaryotic-like serine/threonine-protein kinase
MVFLAVLGAALWFARRENAQVARGAMGCPPDMVFVPGGSFSMGTSQKSVDYLIKFCNNTIGNCDPGWFVPETPQTQATVRAFCMDRYEYPDEKDRYPLTNVTWTDANHSCLMKGKRLCSQEEWERACEGADGRAWVFGNRYQAGACAINASGISQAGSHPQCKSAYGVFDLNGNAAEWTMSRVSPGDRGPDQSDYIIRGGSYRDTPIFTRCAFRDKYPPTAQYLHIGFRCCVFPRQ